MKTLRIGTRGSDLALWQTNWVSQRLREIAPDLEIVQTIIKTHGDLAVQQRFDADWPVGGFVGAIEQAISREEVDLAVHSYKDLQTAVTSGLVVAAIPTGLPLSVPAWYIGPSGLTWDISSRDPP